MFSKERTVIHFHFLNLFINILFVENVMQYIYIFCMQCMGQNNVSLLVHIKGTRETLIPSAKVPLLIIRHEACQI